jgi:hypothetical protein
MSTSVTQSFLNFLRILNRLEVCVFARAVKLESSCLNNKQNLEHLLLPLIINSFEN